MKTKKSPTFCHPSLPGQHSLCEVESGGHCEEVAGGGGGGDGGGGSGSSVLSETGAARRDVFRQLARNREKQTGREKSFFNGSAQPKPKAYIKTSDHLGLFHVNQILRLHL